MPLVRIDAYEGRSQEAIKDLLDGVHREILSAFRIPLRDRYQIYQEHAEPRLIVEDTGLAIERIRNAAVVTITSRQRKPEAKQVFLQGLCRELKASCDIDPADVIVTIVTNADYDWSFGYARAQFVTGEL